MIVDMKCENPKCDEKDVIVTINGTYDEIQLKTCEKCNEKLTRLYSAPAIRTFGDGYKG